MAVAASLVPLAALAPFARAEARRVAEDGALSLELATLDAVAERLERVTRASRRAVAVAADVARAPGLDPDARVAALEAFVAGDPDVAHLAVYGPDGRFVDAVGAEGRTVPPWPARLEALDAPLCARAAADGLVWFACPALGSFADELERALRRHLPGGRLELLDSRGAVLAARAGPGYPDGARARGPVAAGAGAVSSVRRDSSGWVVADLPVGAWVLRASVPEAIVLAPVVSLERRVLVAFVAAFALAVGLALAFSARVTRPLAELVDDARHLASRRFAEVQVRTASRRRRDEIGALSDVLGEAAAALERADVSLRAEAEVRSDLSRFLPAHLVERVVRREQDLALGGRRAHVTVLFADVAEFAAIAESLPPEQVVEWLGELFTLATEVVFRHGGVVDKIVGDGVMALFGAVGDGEDHAARAVAASDDLHRLVRTAGCGWERRFGHTVWLAVGVHTGEALVGNLGSDRRVEFTAVGDVVNVAARLEALARPGATLLTEATRRASGRLDLVDLGERRLPGRQATVRLWERAP